MNKLDFIEIGGHEIFESLVASYFSEIKSKDDNQITEIRVEPTGEGPDGGRDILITCRLSDSIVCFERKWVIQCKFYNKLRKSDMDRISIQSLIAEYGANGYLLVCKGGVTAGVTEAFEKWRLNCNMNYNYELWQGFDFLNRLYMTTNLHRQFFPKYFQSEEIRLKKLESIK